ncbi:MAG: aldo/keto reductase [Erysipelotrichaceae bacterium]|nr:aldo/keto reductase [Erysipelotrichaceae bacterium]
MEKRILGKTGLEVSRMGFGGIPIQKTTAGQTKELLHRLAEKGVTYIDTAKGYTVSEEYIGYGLEGIRDRFVLATKSMSRTKEKMAADIEDSLKKLRTDYIDLYQVHNPNGKDFELVQQPGGALEALQEAKAQGRIGHIGITLHTVDVFEKALECDWVETIMFPYNFIETQAQELIARCKEKNIGFIAMKPLAGGAIEDATLALRYICSNDNVTVVIPGMAELQEVEENTAACENGLPLSEDEWNKITEIKNLLGNHFCRRCNYCQPCTAGINISGIFLFAGYLDRYGLGDWAKSRYATLDKTASDCVECGICETRCPYQLPIREMLKDAAMKFGK